MNGQTDECLKPTEDSKRGHVLGFQGDHLDGCGGFAVVNFHLASLRNTVQLQNRGVANVTNYKDTEKYTCHAKGP